MRSTLLLFVFVFIPFLSSAVCIKSDRANLRRGPGTQFKKTWEVYKYMPFKMVSKRGTWLLVSDLEGDRHWLHSKLITKDHKCAVVKVFRAALRTGPGTKFNKNKIIPEAQRYTSFKLVKTKGNWAQVLAENGEKYWIAKSLLWIY